MNRKVFFAALFIAVMTISATYASPAAATTNPVQSSTPQRNMAGLTIPASLTYDVNGTLIATINASGHLYITTNFAGLSSFNITVKQLYLGLRISAELSNIVINTSSGIVTGYMNVNARLVAKIVIYINSTTPTTQFIDRWHNVTWPVRWVIPWGSTKNFTIPFPSFSVDPTSPSSADADSIAIRFTDANDTWASTQYTVDHVQWDFSNWLRNKIQSGLNDIWGKAITSLQQASIPGIQGGFNVVRCVGKVDLWKTSGTSPDNILLMASGLIDLLIDFSVVGHGSTTFTVLGHTYSATYDINFFAEFGLYFSLAVTSNWQIKTADSGGHYTYNEFLVQVPENATLVWRKIGVIVYYGSPAHGIDVTGGVSRGNGTVGGGVLFFVDYGWDGTPDFATNGTGQPVLLNDDTGTVSGTGTTRTVTLAHKGSQGTWIYFNLDTTGYSIKDIKRGDVTLNATQYWVYTDGLGNTRLYVVDDPAYSYTVELIGGAGGGLSTETLLLVSIAAAVIVIVALVVVMRRRSGSSGVSVKLV